jgi:hypothetical protein
MNMILNQHLLNQNPGLDAALNTDHRIVRDIKARFEQWGKLSPAQIALVFKLSKQQEEQAANPPPVSNWVGEVGKRQQFTLRLERMLRIDNQFGTSYLHTFSDEQGNSYKWFSSAGKLRNQADNPVEEGAIVMVKATVKGHDLYNGRKQTSLNRVKMV